jgi:hypothetical protein
MTLEELERILREVDPAVRLVVPRILRRVIKQDRGLPGFLYRVPHRKSYIIHRDALLESVDPDECGWPKGEELPEKVILLAQPDPQRLADFPRGAVLLHYWRLLFHARVHGAIQNCFALGFLSDPAVRKRAHQIGVGAFDETRTVLNQENFLLPPLDDATVYEEFAALFFELKYFAWHLLPAYFPALDDAAAAAVLEQDVDAAGLFAATRLPGAPDPADQAMPIQFDPWIGDDDEQAPADAPVSSAEPGSVERVRRWMRKAQEPAKLGNLVGAACYRAKALRNAPPVLAKKIRTALKDDIHQLVARLQAALQLPPAASPTWHDALRDLAYHTADGYWTPEARLLYDLQKVCLDSEREIYKLDLLGWLRTFGRRPIRRVLSAQRELLLAQHLRRAEGRMAIVRLTDEKRKQLGDLLREAGRRMESRLREQFRPLMERALATVGLRPQNLPEEVARDKLIEELLDRAADRGFLTFGDLRDALSRNHLKLPDCRGPGEILLGDPLLKADRRWGAVLEGVYRPAEFYLRWMQRVSALAFGTRVGRLLTLLLIVPFGGAYLIQKGLDHLIALLPGLHDVHAFENPSSIAFLGLFFCGLVNSVRFRRLAALSLKDTFRFLNQWIFRPLWIAIQSHVVQVILHSRAFHLLFRYLIKPALYTLVIGMLFTPKGGNWQTTTSTEILLFCSVNLVLNSRIGRTLEEVVSDVVVQSWQRYGLRLITGLFWLVVDFFKTVLETIERMMYAVDEWLRFRRGERPRLLAVKAVLGLLWFCVSYLLRFCVNLLIEPQVNPIKHFPVVTVSHKLLIPLIPSFAGVLEMHFQLPTVKANLVAGLIIFCIPGIFGFLVWELKENWRLYAANRPAGLQPAVIGAHGETMIRLLRPGFHSGTIPKLFARLRRAERKARKTGKWRAARKNFHKLQHVELSLRRFVEREFIALWNAASLPLPPGEGRGEGSHIEAASYRFTTVEKRQDADSTFSPPPSIVLDAIRLASQRVRLSLNRRDSSDEPLVLDLEVQSGWIAANVVSSGWVGRLSQLQSEFLGRALLGFYKTLGVDLVRQQIAACFRAPAPPFDVQAAGLCVWMDATFESEVFYPFDDRPVWEPQSNPQDLPLAPLALCGIGGLKYPLLQRSQILFREYVFLWKDWVTLWDRKDATETASTSFPKFTVLPPAK